MKKTNAGFTLVEVVIAIAIAVLVSIASAAVIISTRTSSRNAAYKNDAVEHAGNITECFKSADNMTDFRKALEFSYLEKDTDGNIVGHMNIDASGCTTDSGATMYLYMVKNGTLYREASETTEVRTEWNAEKADKAFYIVAVNVAKCNTGNVFKATTKLNVAVYGGGLSDEPNMSSASADSTVVYCFDKAYVKGVAG